MSNTFFNKRVQAMLNLLISKKTKNNFTILNDLEKNFLNFDSSELNNEQKWILSIRKTLTEKNIIEENTLKDKMIKILNNSSSLSSLENKKFEFLKGNTTEEEKIKRIEGHPVKSGIYISTLFKSPELLFLKIIREKNTTDPAHHHGDHDTISYLLSGKLRLLIGENSYIATSTDMWVHKKNVVHKTEALEKSIQLTIKTNPVKTW
tara:strand:- start:1003 stop:1620 length:618 start_codon:yes stop_codon:yes gene_type:complete